MRRGDGVMGTWIDEKARFWHWCEKCNAPSWFHMFTNKYDEYTSYFCNTQIDDESVCNNEKYTMENDEYSEGNHENAVLLEIEGIYDDEESVEVKA